MKTSSRKTLPLVLMLMTALLFAEAAFAASEEKLDHDYSRLAFFAQPSISFLNFEEREYFQNAIDTIYWDFKSVAATEAESLNVAMQDFQKVNFCFPLMAGIQFQPTEDHFISAGIGFIYDNESVVLTDRKGTTHNYSYTLQGVPLFLEYRLAFPKNLISLSEGSLFSIAVRWYWTLPGTEIYTTWGKLEAKNSILGAGFGISLGYLFASWKNFNLYGDFGFSSISVKSKDKFSKIVPGGPEEKAKWNLGGLQFQIRVSYGVWNKPKKKANEDDDDDDDSPESSPNGTKGKSNLRDVLKSKNSVQKTTAEDSAAAIATDTAFTDTTFTDTSKVQTQADSTAMDSTSITDKANDAGATKDTIKNSAAKDSTIATDKIDTATAAKATATPDTKVESATESTALATKSTAKEEALKAAVEEASPATAKDQAKEAEDNVPSPARDSTKAE